MDLEEFDPYHKWLAIPPQEQPPHHYRLLGLALLEDQPDVIEVAADRQMAHVRTFQGGPFATVSQRVLNELATARHCLLNPTTKATYDSELVRQLPPNAPPIAIQPSPPPDLPSATRKNKSTTLFALGIAMTAFVLLLAVSFGILQHRNTPPLEGPSQSPATVQAGFSSIASEPNGLLAEKNAQHPSVNDPNTMPNHEEPAMQLAQAGEESLAGVAENEEKDDEPVSDDSPPSQRKLPIPDDTAQKEATSVIKDVYKSDYDQAKTPAQRLELARKLLQEGIQTEGDSIGKFVLLRIARDLAAQAGDVSVPIQAIDQIATAFEIEPLEMKVEVLTKMSKSVSTVPAQKELVGAIERVTDAAVDVDKHVIAQQLAGLAITVSRNAKDGGLLKRSVARSKEIEQNAAAFAEAQKALKVLDEKPTDPDANLVVGKFRCFHRRDWENGLPLLTLGSDAKLKGLAEKEATPPSKANDQAALGDGWWTIAEKEVGVAKGNVQSRASFWYEQALPALSGLPKAKVEKRLAEMSAASRTKITHAPSQTDMAGAKPSAEDSVGVGGIVISPAMLHKKFSGKSVFNKKTGELTLTYDFKTKKQLDDFESGQAKISLGNGVIRIGPEDKLSHLVQFSTVTVNGQFRVENMGSSKGDGWSNPFIQTTSGVSVGTSDNYGGVFRLLSGKEHLGHKPFDGNQIQDNFFPISLSLTDKKAAVRIGTFELAGKVNSIMTGRVEFLGAKGGLQIHSLVISGVPEEEWARQFFAP